MYGGFEKSAGDGTFNLMETSLSDAGTRRSLAFGCVTQGCYVSLRQVRAAEA